MCTSSPISFEEPPLPPPTNQGSHAWSSLMQRSIYFLMTQHARFVGGERGGMTSNCFLKNKNFHTGAHLMAEGDCIVCCCILYTWCLCDCCGAKRRCYFVSEYCKCRVVTKSCHEINSKLSQTVFSHKLIFEASPKCFFGSGNIQCCQN